MRRFQRLLLWLLILLPASARADLQSWSYLVEKLTGDGIDRERVVAVFADPRVDPFTGLEFNPERPRERHSIYSGFRTPKRVAAARRCRAAHAASFESAARRYGVSADVIASILFVESGCGRNSGSSVIVHRLARLAMANEPENLQRNFDRFSDDEGRLKPELERQLRERARYLEQTFYPEVRAVFEVAERMGVDPLEIRGSISGAFGFPQFLPTSYLRFGVDANDDGQVSLYDLDDAAASCGRYLAAHGWHAGATRQEKRAAIWSYNHSEAYIDSVLGLATQLGRPAGPAKQVVKVKNRPRRDARRPQG